ncbi:hypothetical protein P152DRAFT_462020 [Eremomyces bilateralis CBS 781.70]|uniref:Actin binding protein n=1 Tax=Eremomyces bilateralis CBS 781.70 TaxID=1392243 RepID=A0A6G1FT47_9PEZI|nr:uncharacterized protein P152DRAFT_462020 [Eremomyces bilateralis CBS 781.70]KAF1808967.1 hypothetical protein P152DRAFT_462020 [Eremomyces bilateralis CBS 781.70]
MATLNLSANGPSITKSYQNVVNATLTSAGPAASPTYGQWALFSVAAPLVSAFQQDAGKESVLKVQTTGEGELVDLLEEFSDGRIQFAFVKVKDPNTTLPKSVLIAWCGEGVPERTKGYFTSHLAAVSKLLHGYHVQVTARSDRDLSPEAIIQKVSDASGSKYSGGPATKSSNAPPPPAASKPVFTPTQIGGSSSGFNPLGSRTRVAQPSGPTDGDGWGEDAPPVTRSQLEKVAPAYKPTKVDMASLSSGRDESTKLPFRQQEDTSGARSDVVKGAYQPVGKVDIAELRRQAKESGNVRDDRPTVVKGSYEPVGKVDIAAIRARAQGPGSASTSPAMSPAATGGDADQQPKSLSERSSAFSQSERLTSLPKPKVANKFGAAPNFAGTKAPAPGGFQPKTAPTAAPVGIASRTFADQGGKTPAQLWAEKKALGRGDAVPTPSAGFPGAAPSIANQKSGDGGWESGYAGKKWGAVQTTRTGQSAVSNTSQPDSRAEAPEDEQPSGGIGSIRDRFKEAPPMGVPATSRPVPPPMELSTKPAAEEIPATQRVNVPIPPPQPRSPSPEEEEEPMARRPSSPIRVAMPVGRGAVPEPEEEEEEPPRIPVQPVAQAAVAAREVPAEPTAQDDDPARGASHAIAASTFGQDAPTTQSQAQGGKTAIAQYDYEKAEDNEIELREGATISNIDMVDEDWWIGQNEQGETGLFPSNYVELVEDDAPGAAPSAPPAPPAAAPPATESGPTATAMYDYEAAEENELSFPDGAKITNVEFPDDDWWIGEFGGHKGLFPANYVELDQ